MIVRSRRFHLVIDYNADDASQPVNGIEARLLDADLHEVGRSNFEPIYGMEDTAIFTAVEKAARDAYYADKFA